MHVETGDFFSYDTTMTAWIEMLRENLEFQLVCRLQEIKQFVKVITSKTTYVGGVPWIVKSTQDWEEQKMIKERNYQFFF